MLSLSFSRYLMIRLAAVAVVLATALPLTGVMAGEKPSTVEVELVDRWELMEDRRVHGTMMIRLRLHDGKTIRVDGDQLYVLEKGNNRIQILTTDGDYIGTFGAYGSGNGQLNQPSDMALYN